MGFNLFLTAAEVFKEFYSSTEHLVFIQYLFFGFKGHSTLVPYAWASVATGLIAFLLFLVPRTRTNWVTLNLGCLLIYSSVYIEKGMGLIIPGLTPDVLGEMYIYTPSATEIFVAAGIFALGFLVFTLMLKAAVPVMLGEFVSPRVSPAAPETPAPPRPGQAEPDRGLLSAPDVLPQVDPHLEEAP
jgi:molybdopterin-containing oxidoreductase family membrane subunit